MTARQKEMEAHAMSMQHVAPSGAVSVTVTSAGGAWTLGNLSNDIIAAAAVPGMYMTHFIVVSGMTANAEYELVLYHGATDIECGRAKWVRANVNTRSFTSPLGSLSIPAGDRLKAKLMDSVGGSACNVSVYYHHM